MIKKIRPVELVGDIEEDQDLSGLVIVDDFLLVGSDEGHAIQLLVRQQENVWRIQSSIRLSDARDETDLEALCFAQDYLYAVGSHSRRRRVCKLDYKAKKNLKRLTKVDRQKSRERLYRIPFDRQHGTFGTPKSISLMKLLRADPVMRRFVKIPSKENGVDIEGLAIANGCLYLGFRGPVLRSNLVPVWSLEFESPHKYQQLFVDLKGQGIRDMVTINAGFLILSGPVNDMPGVFQLWYWDGQDQLPAIDREYQPAKCLGEIDAVDGAKAEGLAIMSQGMNSVDLLVMYDSIAKGGCALFRVEL
ncbi:MAG: DUF3616 domain-containing protein [Gammaproteobacteria bacterium]|nr:DUF3616 domain-containing protein [Gammaproteobacteria bacterium]